MKVTVKTWAGLAIIMVVVGLAVVTTQRAGGHRGWHSWRRCAARQLGSPPEHYQLLCHHVFEAVLQNAPRVLLGAAIHMYIAI